MKKIYAPIDNKNLMEDPFEDEVFRDFYAARYHRKNGQRHLIGMVSVPDERGVPCESAIVDAEWVFGAHQVSIKVLAVPGTEDFEDACNQVLDYYTTTFKAWECDDNPGLRVRCSRMGMECLFVSFYFETED